MPHIKDATHDAEEEGRLYCPDCWGSLMAKGTEYWSVRADKLGSPVAELYNHDTGEIDIICDCDDRSWKYDDLEMP